MASHERLTCEMHKETVVLICKYHRALVCLQCVKERIHIEKSCDLIDSKEEDIEKYFFDTNCNNLNEIIEQNKKQRVEFYNEYDTIKDKLIVEVKCAEESLIAKIIGMREATITKICKGVTERQGALQVEIKCLEDLSVSMQELMPEKKLLNDIDYNASKNEVHDMKVKLADIDKQINEMTKRTTKPFVNFHPANYHETFKCHGDLLGNVCFYDEIVYASDEIESKDTQSLMGTETVQTEEIKGTMEATAEEKEQITGGDVNRKSTEVSRQPVEPNPPQKTKSRFGFMAKFKGKKKTKESPESKTDRDSITPKEIPTTKADQFSAERKLERDNITPKDIPGTKDDQLSTRRRDKENIYEVIDIERPKPTFDKNLYIEGLSKNHNGTPCHFVKIRALQDNRIVILDDDHQTIMMVQYEGYVTGEKHFDEHVNDMCVMSSDLVAVTYNDKKETNIAILNMTNDYFLRIKVIKLNKIIDGINGFDFYPTTETFAISTPSEFHNIRKSDNDIESTSFKRGPTLEQIVTVHDYDEAQKEMIYSVYRQTNTVECFSCASESIKWRTTLEADVPCCGALTISRNFLHIPCKDTIATVNALNGGIIQLVESQGDNMCVGIDETNGVLLITKDSKDPKESKTVRVVLNE